MKVFEKLADGLEVPRQFQTYRRVHLLSEGVEGVGRGDGNRKDEPGGFPPLERDERHQKANEGKVSMGVASTVQRVSGALLQKLTDTQFTLVPYRGAGPALQDVVAGQIELVIDQPSNMLPQLRAGTVKAIAVTANRRLTSAPDVPSNAEAGLPGLNISGWNAVWAPRNTPPDIVDKLNAAIVEALNDEGVKKKLSELGQDIPTPDQLKPKALGDFQKSEIDKWWPIVREAGIKIE